MLLCLSFSLWFVNKQERCCAVVMCGESAAATCTCLPTNVFFVLSSNLLPSWDLGWLSKWVLRMVTAFDANRLCRLLIDMSYLCGFSNVVFHLVSKYDNFFFFSNAALFSLFHCFYVLYSFLGVVGTWPGQAFFAFLLWLDISGAF